MADNIIKLQAVSDLLDKHFFIPDYQRGYRWTGQQVKDLLKDLWDFCQGRPILSNSIACNRLWCG